jgi:protein O-GlcNAc transferase
MNADVPTIPAPFDWWNPIRANVLTAVGKPHADAEIKTMPVVTYINRQKTGRRLAVEDDASMLEALDSLHSRGVIEFHNAFMEDYSRAEQVGRIRILGPRPWVY